MATALSTQASGSMVVVLTRDRQQQHSMPYKSTGSAIIITESTGTLTAGSCI